MQISGFIKMTLLDYPNKVAATVFTGGCNMRCPFCHNPKLVFGEIKTPAVSNEDFFAFLKKRKHFLDGICITGGEPTMQKDLEEFMKKIKAFGLLVKLDTNGTFPKKIRNWIEQGIIDYVAMDIKNSPEKYAMTMGASQNLLDLIMESVKLLKEGKIEYEFRTTVVKEFHEEDDFHKIGAWLKGANAYYLQKFRDCKATIIGGLHPVEDETMERFRAVASLYIENTKIRG